MDKERGTVPGTVRTNSCPLLAAYRNAVNPAESAECPHCKMGVPKTVQHFLVECPPRTPIRQRIFGVAMGVVPIASLGAQATEVPN